MEPLLIVVIVLLLAGFLVAVATRGRSGRTRDRTPAEAGGRPDFEADPGASRPAGPGAESQDPAGAGTLHPPGQVDEPGEQPAARPPHENGGRSGRD